LRREKRKTRRGRKIREEKGREKEEIAAAVVSPDNGSPGCREDSVDGSGRRNRASLPLHAVRAAIYNRFLWRSSLLYS
jgi:hypothetical protein